MVYQHFKRGNALSDLNRALDFVSKWTGVSAPKSTLFTLSDNLPEPLRRLGLQLGTFWGEPPYPFKPQNLDYNRRRGLFAVQDVIKNPQRQQASHEGLTALISENQGVWHFSYDNQNRLYFEGDWPWGDFTSSNEPIAFPAEIENVLCFTLLGNFFHYVDGTDWQEIFDPADKWPEDITIKLWDHPAWNNYKGFWTNKDGTALLFDGVGCFRRPESLTD